MSQILSAKRICEEALGAISEFPVTESAADPEALRRAMTWLDLILAERAGTGRLFFLIPATLAMPIVNGQSTYNLESALGSELPPDRLQYPVEAWLEDETGNRFPIEIQKREDFEKHKADLTGQPCHIYIDRLTPPTLQISPTPPADDTKTYTLKLIVQTYAPNVAPGGVTGTIPSASTLHNFRVAYQRWMIFQLAHDLGSGPITKLPETSLKRFESQAALAMLKLEAYENQEHDTERPVSDSWED